MISYLERNLIRIWDQTFLREVIVVFLFFIITAFIFFPFLGGNNIIRGPLVYSFRTAGYTFFKPLSDSLKQMNQIALWSPYIDAGFPVWLSQAGFFNPLGIVLFKFFDYILAYNWLTYLNFTFSGLAAYWLGRNLSLSIRSSIIVGIAYELSQNNLLWGSEVIFSNMYLFLPILFLSILKLYAGKKIWLLGGGVIGCLRPNERRDAGCRLRVDSRP